MEANGEHGAESPYAPARRSHREQAVAEREQGTLVSDGEPDVVEPPPLEHRRGEAVGCGIVPDDLEQLQHDVSRHHDGLAGVAGAGAEDDGRFETDGVFVEGAKSVEIGRHHGDVAHAHQLAHLRFPGRILTPCRRST